MKVQCYTNFGNEENYHPVELEINGMNDVIIASGFRGGNVQLSVVNTYVHGPVSGNHYDTCSECNYDRHTCPGCGEWLHHGTSVCGPCKAAL